ncbi:carboxyl transferase domain-containing protein [Peptostreptococcus equinus]|uniref:acetyl-CoA carboxytransferase n=1 Tax=Peptostreptococcus equinus TaxID=3003601 RepID=A0ABY7JQR5_9FIRM|nr:carboxyl transferase domain-containing protein [Peptostreptococcus sp. CBA3647]WAW14297.1 acetyl-CoA carboxylase carboxyl transferase subunit alpha [Peptostreptococcus sp. CBA3647]
MKAIQKVYKAREPDRKKAKEYIEYFCNPFVELHGDRLFSEDNTIICGIGKVDRYSVMVISQEKSRNYGMVNPEGYRKVLRMLRYAEKFSLPVITIVDTPGAACGIGAEERGQANAIANCIYEFSKLKVPTLSIVIGEGGSGGALALSVTDQIWMLENSVYSILSPEGFASILWKDSNLKEKAADLMKLTSQDMLDAGFIEKIIKEDGGEVYNIKNEIIKFLEKSYSQSIEKILKKRYDKYRRINGG